MTLLALFQASGDSSALGQAPDWVQTLVGAVGGWGLLAVAFFDSSFGTLPIINDVLVIALSIQNPEGMVFYASMATIGSVLGCLTIFYLARKGGDMVLRRKASPQQIERMRRWYEKNEFLTVAIPAVMPPPTPFKVFILAAGVFQVRLRYFLAALALGRGLRYFLWGLLAVQFGERAITFLRTHYLQVSGAAIALVLLGFLLMRVAERHRARRRAPSS